MLADALDWGQGAVADERAAQPAEDAREASRSPTSIVPSQLRWLATNVRRRSREKWPTSCDRCRELVKAGHKVVILDGIFAECGPSQCAFYKISRLLHYGQIPLYDSDDDESGERLAKAHRTFSRPTHHDRC